MRSIVYYFIKYPIAADLLIFLFSFLGILSIMQLTKSRFPPMQSNLITIETSMSGASPKEIERGVTIKIENELQGITGIKKINSQSQENLSIVNITMTSKADVDQVLRDVKNAIDGINTFPADAEKSIISLKEIKEIAATLALYGDMEHRKLKAIANNIKQELLTLNDISEITFIGNKTEEIEIALSEASLQRFGLDINQVAQAVANKNTDLTAGTIEANGEELTIRAVGKKYYATDLENIVVKNSPSGGNIYLKDVAVLSEIYEDGSIDNYLNGHPAISINVLTTSKQDISNATDKVKDYIDKFNKNNLSGTLSLIEDGSVVVQQRLDMLVKNGLIGMVLVLLVLGLFLNIRLAFWVALSIPVSMLGMFILAPYFDVNVNMFSLFGLILSLGILVDDGIVISENIYKKYEDGMPAYRAAWQGLKEVSAPVLIAVVTTCLFFSLFFFLEGTIGDFVADIGFIVVVTLLISLVEGFLILPAHIAHSKALQRGRKPNKIEKFGTMVFDTMRARLYEPTLRFSLENKLIAFVFFMVPFMILIAMMVGGRLQFNFFPYIDEDVQGVQLEMPAGTTKDKTYALIQNIEQTAIKVNEAFKSERKDGKDLIRDYVVQVGPEKNKASLKLYLLDGETRNMESFHIINAIQKNAGSISEAAFVNFGNVSFFGSAIAISLKGSNYNRLKEVSHKITNGLKTFPEMKSIVDNDEESGKEFNIELTPEAKALGLTLREIAEQLRFSIFGYEVQTLQRGNEEVAVNVRYDQKDIDSYDRLENLKIKINNNEYTLNTIAKFVPTRSTKVIHHEKGLPTITITAEQVDPNESTPEIQAKIEQELLHGLMKSYPDVTYEFAGQSESALETVESSMKVMPVIILLVFFSIVINFRSFKQATVVLILIPFTFIGVAIGHLIHGIPISILSFYGVIAVAGVVINDSLVLVSRMNQLLQTGMSFNEAVFVAGTSRFRAIVLTSVTTIAGLSSLIFETSLQAKLMIPMAISLAYGLASATFIMLLLLPVFLKTQNSMFVWLHWLWEGEEIEKEDVEPAVREWKRLQHENELKS